MSKIYESDVENFVITLLEKQGYTYLSPEDQEEERQDLSDVVLRERLKKAIDLLNPNIPEEARDQALREVLNLPSQNLIENNESFHKMLTDGVGVEYQKNGETIGDQVLLVDFKEPKNNDLLVCNQFTVAEDNQNRRPDVMLLINGLPLVIIELKNPTDEKATVHKAFTQLQNYKNAIPSLFQYNGVLVASDGLDAKTGSLTAGWEWFMPWKTVDGVREDKKTTPQIETLIKGMLRPDILLDLIKQFTVFEKTKTINPVTGITSVDSVKKIAAYHQYHAVNKAIESTIRATTEAPMILKESPTAYGLPSADEQPKGDHKAGVVWHTQGSGKSLSMVFYSGKLIIDPRMKNPTLVVITDRNDLDEQLFETFASSHQLLRQKPVQAKNRKHLKKHLKTAGGGIVFTTIQKFSPEDLEENFEKLSLRENIVVIADEAHRSQYGFSAKTLIKKDGVYTKYGFAKYLRDAIPNASFIGFTGTPIEKEDASTPAVFGNYVDVYDIKQAVIDEATVKIYYESRLAKVHLKEEEKEKLDAEVEAITENEESTAKEKAKTKWTQLEAIVGHKDRLKMVAKDLVEHFEAKQEVFEGKGMIVAMSRRIAVEFYGQIIKIRPDWHNKDKNKGVIKVIMTSSSSDPERWQQHHTTKQTRKELGERLKDPNNSLKLVIVRDMWLTGFDAPSLHTMYIDKSMRGHNLMQAIARVNRVYKDKPGGLIVDYIGIATELKKALANYTDSGGKGKPAFDQSEAIALMMEKYEIVVQMFHSFNYKKYFSANTQKKMAIILESQEHILKHKDGKNRFTKQVSLLSKAFALSIPSLKALEIKDEVGFFQAIKARLVKFEPTGNGKSDAEIETAIRQIVDKAVVADGVIDIFDASGIKKPDISILSDEFLEEVKNMKQKNIALELLKKLLGDEISLRKKKNLIQSKKLSEMLDIAIKKYHNNLLTAAQVIEELIEIANKIKTSDDRGNSLGLSDYEIAFYDALVVNGSARDVMKDKTLQDLARILVKKVKSNTSIDWTIKEGVQAKLRVIVKRILRQYGYPPDKQKLATENILKQAELFADEWSS
jgi:type I restriction enzyme, R subunit